MEFFDIEKNVISFMIRGKNALDRDPNFVKFGN